MQTAKAGKQKRFTVKEWSWIMYDWANSIYATNIMAAIFLGLSILGYLLYAAMMGGKYCVIFTMDENGVIHEQIPEQAKKARKLGILTAGAGLATGRLSTIGLGINVANRTSMYSDFKCVRSVKKGLWGNVIKIREILSNNQVYTHDEDFDFVYNYIREHCPKVHCGWHGLSYHLS